MGKLWICLAMGACVLATPVAAQTICSLKPQPLPPLANPDDPALPAKELFGRAPAPASLPARALGSYAKGCLAGAQALAVDGATWQAMRLSRQRMFGHPKMVNFLELFSKKAAEVTGWPGLLIGDISQARGGPMLTGHASHQIGLDADLWLTPMPERRLSADERETMMATNMVASDWTDIDPVAWTPAHVRLIRAAALQPEVQRVLVNPAIKKALCRSAGADRAWLRKVRPTPGHNYHFHIRLACPKNEAGCASQEQPPAHDGCGAELDWWFTDEARKPSPPRPSLTLGDLPGECKRVLVAR